MNFRLPIISKTGMQLAIPVHKLPCPQGNDVDYLTRLMNEATEQYLIADESAQIGYLEYIENCRTKIALARGIA